MKVFFSASPRANSSFHSFYKVIFNELINLGYTLLDDDVVKVTPEKFDNLMNKGHQTHLNYFHKKIKAIHDADICVFESSVPSSGIGLAIEMSLEQGKPTVVLYYKDNIPYFVSTLEEEKLILKKYDEKSLKKVLHEIMDSAKKRRDKRFNFFISPRLLDYLVKESKTEAITKSKFIRNLILDHMKRTS